MTEASEAMEGAPEFDLYSTQIDADPFPAYARLRDHHPCYWSDRNGIWMLTRYQDVQRAANDWRLYSSAAGNMIDELPDRAGATLGTTDPPRHDRLRQLSQSAFMRRNLETLEEPTIAVADRAIEMMRDCASFDFVADFASRITVAILFQMLGLPELDHGEVRRKVVLAVSTDKVARGRSAEQIAAFSELGAFISEQVARRRIRKRDDLISALALAEVDGDRLSEREVVLTTATFVMAGVESLSSFMSMFALNLHDHPDQRGKLVADPGLIPAAIEESLRFNTSAQRFKRVLTRDIDLHGQHMKAGDKVALVYGSANRDPRKFEDPDRFDVNRRSHAHLGFGAGPHFCLGSHMARLVTSIAMSRFLKAIPDFSLVRTKLEWIPSSNFRSPVELRFAAG